MLCGVKEADSVYRPRHPQQSPFYQLVERFYAEFEAVYEERYQEHYGFWRPVFLNIAYDSTREVEYQIGLAHRLGFLPDSAHGELGARSTDTAKVLNGLLRSLRH